MSVFKRVAAALAANAFGQVVTVGSLILLTPLFFRAWGATLYGEWLILSSIPAYLLMADLGIGTAAGNEMSMRAGAGDRRGAQQTFFGSLWLAVGTSMVVLLLGSMASLVAFHWRLPATPSLLPRDTVIILMGLSLAVGFAFVGGVLQAGFRCCERNALGIFLANLARLVDALVTGALLLIGQSPLWVCLWTLPVKLLLLLVQLGILRRVCPWLFAPGVSADTQILRRLIKPALGFLAFPLGNAIALQGPILIIGTVFGGASVAMFAALRTLARLPLQITNMFNWSVSPEMSRAFGAGDLQLLRRLHRAGYGVSFCIVVMSALGLELLGHALIRLWLGTHAPFDATVFAVLVLATVLTSIWSASWVVLAATNQHLRSGMVYVVVNALCIAAAAVAARLWGWTGLLLPMLLAEVLLLLWVSSTVLRTTGDSLRPFARAAAAESLGRIRQTVGRWFGPPPR